MQRILIVRMGSLGDIVHTLPAAATLKAAFPEAELDWLVEKQWAALLDGNPCLARLHIVETRALRDNPTGRGRWRSLMETVSRLRRRRYDCALDFQGLLKSALAARLSAAERVLGFHRSELREPFAGLFYTRSAPPAGSACHVVEKNLVLAAEAGATTPIREFPLRVRPEDEQSIGRQVVGLGRFAVVSPAAGWAAKCWPPECYGRLAARIGAELGWSVVVNCGPGEDALAAAVIQNAASARTLLLKPTLGELMALMWRASVVVAGDTGPLHLAAALGAPVVAVFGPTDPRRNGPYSAKARVVRSEKAETTYSRRAGADAIRDIEPGTVFAAVLDVVNAA